MFTIERGGIIIFFTFSFGKIWKFENLFVSLQLIWNQEQGAKNKDLIALAVIIHKPKISLTELHRLYVKECYCTYSDPSEKW